MLVTELRLGTALEELALCLDAVRLYRFLLSVSGKVLIDGFAERFLESASENRRLRLPDGPHKPTRFAQRPKRALARTDFASTPFQAASARHCYLRTDWGLRIADCFGLPKYVLIRGSQFSRLPHGTIAVLAILLIIITPILAIAALFASEDLGTIAWWLPAHSWGSAIRPGIGAFRRSRSRSRHSRPAPRIEACGSTVPVHHLYPLITTRRVPPPPPLLFHSSPIHASFPPPQIDVFAALRFTALSQSHRPPRFGTLIAGAAESHRHRCDHQSALSF